MSKLWMKIGWGHIADADPVEGQTERDERIMEIIEAFQNLIEKAPRPS